MKQNEQKAVAFGKLLATLGRPEACFRTLYLDDADAAEYLSLLFHGAAALFDGTQDAEIPALRKWYRAAIKCGKGEGALTLGLVQLMTALCNLLPLPGCDGARALLAALSLLLPPRVADGILSVLSGTALFFLLFALLFLLNSEGGGGVLLLLAMLLARALRTT